MMSLTMMNWRRFFTAAAIVITCTSAASGQERRVYSPPTSADSLRASFAENGMVVAQERLAAQIGADSGRQGGSGLDAAVAVGFALAVRDRRAGDIGGGGFMVIHSAGRGQGVAMDYREPAPAATTRDICLGPDGKPEPAKSLNSALG